MRTSRVLAALVLVLSCVGVFAVGRLAWAADEPLAEAGLTALLDLKIDEAAIVARINKAGLAFSPDDAALQRLADKGASNAVLNAVQQAGAKKPAAGAAPPITFVDVLKLLELQIPEEQILKRLDKSPTVFTLSAQQIAQLQGAGASPSLLQALASPRAAPPQAAELISNVALVLDCSGSMKETTTDGETKMEAAQRVLGDLIQKIPDGLNVTLVIYGHEVYGGADDPRNCQAVKVARPLAPLDAAGKAELSQFVARLRPTGGTPIALALKVTGEELAKHADECCGIVLLTDGLESCKGNPAEEVAALLGKLKLSFGVNVVGLGVNDDADAALKALADAGQGRYFGPDSSQELAAALGQLAQEIDQAAAPPKKAVSNRRAVKVLKPAIEFPEYKEIQVVSFGLGSISVDATGKYGDEIRIPSATTKYEIRWVPKTGLPVAMLKDFTLAERKVIEIKPEEHLGLIQVSGVGKPKTGIIAYQRGLGSILRLQECANFGEIMVVPAVKLNVSVDGEDIEQDLQVEAGTLHELE